MSRILARSRLHLQREANEVRNRTELIKRFQDKVQEIQLEHKRQDVDRQLTALRGRVLKEFYQAVIEATAENIDAALQRRRPVHFEPRITITPEGNVNGVYRVFSRFDAVNLTEAEFIDLVENLRRTIAKAKLNLEEDPSHILEHYLAEFVRSKTRTQLKSV